MPNKIPAIEEVIEFLEGYGWKYREQTLDNNDRMLLSNYRLSDSDKGVLISLFIKGEFVIVSTVGLLNNVPVSFAPRLLSYNDTLKLVKVYSTNSTPTSLDVELGFELWAESWKKDTFYAFMDMFCLGIDTALGKIEQEKIPHVTNFISYQH